MTLLMVRFCHRQKEGTDLEMSGVRKHAQKAEEKHMKK